jgi:hypothetical protein
MDVWDGNLRLDDSNEIRGMVYRNNAQDQILTGMQTYE